MGNLYGDRAMNITIPNYEILNFETESLVISEAGISKVHSQSLLQALRQIQLSSVMTREELDEVFCENGLNACDAFKFLEKIIPLIANEEMYFEKTIIVHDWKGRTNFEDLFRQELSAALEIRNFSSDTVSSLSGGKYFIVLICYAYDYSSVKKLHFDMSKASPQSAITVCWPMGGFFCIGQPYIAEIGNPCHFCNVDRLVHSASIVSVKNEWARVLNFCKGKHASVPSKELSFYQELIVVGAIIRKIKFFTEPGTTRKYQDDVLYVSYLQLSDGQLYEEPASHWYMCDCLGEGA